MNMIEPIKLMYNLRLDICKECPKFDSNHQQCILCGCYMKAKALIPGAKCPLSKW